MPRARKEMFLVYENNINNLLIKEHHLIEKHQIYCLEKVSSRELYNRQLMLRAEKPTAEVYFEKNFWNPVSELEFEIGFEVTARLQLQQILYVLTEDLWMANTLSHATMQNLSLPLFRKN